MYPEPKLCASQLTGMNEQGHKQVYARLKAFTLVEMMVVMALAAIVVSLGWNMYRNFYNLSLDHYGRARRVQEWEVFDRFFTLDLQRSRQARLRGNVFVFQNPAGRDSIRYEMSSDKVIRIENTFDAGFRRGRLCRLRTSFQITLT